MLDIAVHLTGSSFVLIIVLLSFYF